MINTDRLRRHQQRLGRQAMLELQLYTDAQSLQWATGSELSITELGAVSSSFTVNSRTCQELKLRFPALSWTERIFQHFPGPWKFRKKIPGPSRRRGNPSQPRSMTESIRFQEQFYKQVCAEPRPLAVNPALPTFAAERRAVAPCYRSPVAKLLLRPIWDRQTDGHRTVTRTLVLCTSRGQCQ